MEEGRVDLRVARQVEAVTGDGYFEQANAEVGKLEAGRSRGIAPDQHRHQVHVVGEGQSVLQPVPAGARALGLPRRW